MNLTKQLFRKLARELHPDTNGGDHSRAAEFQSLVEHRDKLCQCGCGLTLPAGRIKFATMACKRGRRFDLSKWLLKFDEVQKRTSRSKLQLSCLLGLLACVTCAAQPELPVVAPNTRGQIALRWDAVSAVTNYLVTVKDALDGQAIQTIASVTNQVTARGLESGRIYWLSAVSEANGTNSPPSVTIKFIAMPPGVGPPITFRATQFTASYDTLADATNTIQQLNEDGTWSDVSGRYFTNNVPVSATVPNAGGKKMFRVKVSE